MLVWNDILLVDCIVPVAKPARDLPGQLKNVKLVLRPPIVTNVYLINMINLNLVNIVKLA
jgi:hypothetical protein